jgi:hypothetical protein
MLNSVIGRDSEVVTLKNPQALALLVMFPAVVTVMLIDPAAVPPRIQILVPSSMTVPVGAGFDVV